MKTHLPSIIKRHRLRENALGVTVTLKWKVFVGPTAIDPTTGNVKGVTESRTETIKALYYEVQPIVSGVRIFDEIETGDCLLAVDPALDLAGRESLTFVITGKEWVQKQVGRKLAESWDAVVADQKTSRTLLLTLKK